MKLNKPVADKIIGIFREIASVAKSSLAMTDIGVGRCPPVAEKIPLSINVIASDSEAISCSS
jgi:hypothetical protein